MSSALTCMVNAMLSIVVVCVVSPVAILALGPLLLFYWRVQVRARTVCLTCTVAVAPPQGLYCRALVLLSWVLSCTRASVAQGLGTQVGRRMRQL